MRSSGSTQAITASAARCSRLWFLGDTIPLFGGLASIGDLLMGAALLALIVSLMRQKGDAAN